MIANSVACSEPAASITARTSSICSSSVAGPQQRSDMPEPRRSKRIRRPRAAMRSKYRATVGCSHSTSMAVKDWGT
jgi:hypothetical protein